MSKRKAKKQTYRSKFEAKIAEQLKKSGVKWEYETKKIKYTVPLSNHIYLPDFVLSAKSTTSSGGFFLEAKGLLDAAARKKMILVKQQNPELDIRFLFMRDQPIRKGSTTTYGDWATKHNFPWAVKEIPPEWLV